MLARRVCGRAKPPTLAFSGASAGELLSSEVTSDQLPKGQVRCSPACQDRLEHNRHVIIYRCAAELTPSELLRGDNQVEHNTYESDRSREDYPGASALGHRPMGDSYNGRLNRRSCSFL